MLRECVRGSGGEGTLAGAGFGLVGKAGNVIEGFGPSTDGALTDELAALLPKTHPRRLCGMFVFVQDAAESVASSDVEVRGLAGVGERSGQGV